MKALIAYLTRLLYRLEHRAAGDVDSIMSPLHKMHDKLTTAQARAEALADKAHQQAASLKHHAYTLEQKTVAAATAANKLGALIGR